MIEKRKVVLVGTGFVGMSMAYSLLNQGGINELVLIDLDKEKAIGEAMDLSHGLPYAPGKMKIKAGGYEECADADIVVITAGAAQKSPDQTRLDLTLINAKIMTNVTESVIQSGFNGIFIIASNPVDLMAYVVKKVSGFPKEKVIGSGTVLDTARLRYIIGEHLNIASNNIHAYVMGEHGDSSLVPWNHCYVGCKKLLDIIEEKGKTIEELQDIHKEVINAGYEIIARKKATYYGIGLSLVRIIKAILNNENAILTVSTELNGEYKQYNIFNGVPAVINHTGVADILNLPLNQQDQEKFDNSCQILKELRDGIEK